MVRKVPMEIKHRKEEEDDNGETENQQKPEKQYDKPKPMGTAILCEKHISNIITNNYTRKQHPLKSNTNKNRPHWDRTIQSPDITGTRKHNTRKRYATRLATKIRSNLGSNKTWGKYRPKMYAPYADRRRYTKRRNSRERIAPRHNARGRCRSNNKLGLRYIHQE